MPYRYIEHTADMGIEAWGSTREEALKEVFNAFTTLLYDTEKVEPMEEKEVRTSSKSLTSGVVDFLSQVLYRYDGEGFLSKELIEIRNLNPVWVVIKGEPFIREKHELRKLIKAVTYHKASFKKRKDIYKIRIILDV